MKKLKKILYLIIFKKSYLIMIKKNSKKKYAK